MAPKLGYVLPTRERIMAGEPAAAPLLRLAEMAEDLGYDSVWVGDSVIAKPRHEPLTLLSGVAARTRRVNVGTAVLLAAMRHPVHLAHQIGTLDQVAEGRFILGVGIGTNAPIIRNEFAGLDVPFDKRVGRLLEGLRLCRALWTGAPVDWDGRWHLEGATVAPVPHREGGPPIWIGGGVRASLERAAREFDGWFPGMPDAASWAANWAELQRLVRAAGRDPAEVTGAIYLTLAIDDDAERAMRQLDAYYEAYYSRPAEMMKKGAAYFAGPAAGAAEWLGGFAKAGVEHLVVRFTGDHERNLAALARIRETLAA